MKITLFDRLYDDVNHVYQRLLQFLQLPLGFTINKNKIMKSSILALAIFCTLVACTPKDLEDLLNGGSAALTTEEVGLGLKEALTKGISVGSDLLSQKDGYYKSIYKIALPEEAQKVANTLSKVPGFSNVEDVIVQKLNRAAESAATEAKPIFVSAIRQMTIQDAWNILKGEDNAATTFLQRTTQSALYNKFQPVILNSLNEVNAVDYWADAVNTYNKIPLVNKANPRLDDYVTNEALDGLFAMVAKEEEAIRQNPAKRVTDLLKKVFAAQD